MGKSQKRTIAIILNALVCPGIGQIYLGYRLRGAVMAIASAFLIILPLTKYMMMIFFSLNVARVRNKDAMDALIAASDATWPVVNRIVIFAFIGLAIVWIFAMYDVIEKTKRNQNEGL